MYVSSVKIIARYSTYLPLVNLAHGIVDTHLCVLLCPTPPISPPSASSGPFFLATKAAPSKEQPFFY